MATNRKPKALLDAEKKIVELVNRVETLTKEKDQWYKQWIDMRDIVNGLHDVLDDLGIRRYRDDNKYQELPISVRLFAWAMGVKKAE